MLSKRIIAAEVTKVQNKYIDNKGWLNYSRKIEDNVKYLDKELEELFKRFNIPFFVDCFSDDISIIILMTFVVEGKLERIKIDLV